MLGRLTTSAGAGAGPTGQGSAPPGTRSGIVMYELLTSEFLPGGNFVAVAMRHIDEGAAAGGGGGGGVPARVEAAIQKAMAKRAGRPIPDDGKRSHNELESASRESGVEAGTQVGSPRRPTASPPQHRRHRLAVSRRSGRCSLRLASPRRRGGSCLRSSSSGTTARERGRATALAVPCRSKRCECVRPLRRRRRARFRGGTRHRRECRRRTGRPRAIALRRTSASLASVSFWTPVPSAAPPARVLDFDAGAEAKILAGDSLDGPFDAVVGRSQTVELGRPRRVHDRGRRAPDYVIWITRLGNGYRSAHVNEVRAD